MLVYETYLADEIAVTHSTQSTFVPKNECFNSDLKAV